MREKTNSFKWSCREIKKKTRLENKKIKKEDGSRKGEREKEEWRKQRSERTDEMKLEEAGCEELCQEEKYEVKSEPSVQKERNKNNERAEQRRVIKGGKTPSEGKIKVRKLNLKRK